ncbi:putative nadh:ubiquinone oxidoreductase subunit protein [Golovinomyces cichoracearum]|uniref:Putative nadh:ubiquinone oxidoreductase subunit protein n=1 Tax=Golovinomyces cichoracearum TaxID=62708 RepID=A0A420IDV7_9PEZI|nr:putative nadh:ubiquinone oxidoreductase subunit protein [Golovinomyces cichoracearum]
MLCRRHVAAHVRLLRTRTHVASSRQVRRAGSTALDSSDSEYPKLTDLEDPGMNGGYINPPRIKRHFRDPHADWWDKQERRNFGEPIHEDNDILGITAFFQIGCFIGVVFGLAGVVRLLYPDRPSVAKKYEGGLERELGGSGTVVARYREDE